jgi:FtsP/CotA-like multicopper oxidase with cupredoxin domain
MSQRYDDGNDDSRVTRRSFLEKALVGASVVSTGVIVGTAGWVVADSEQPEGVSANGAEQTHAAMDMNAATAPATQEHTAEEMDRLHKEGVDAFLKNQATPITKGRGNQPLQPEIVNGVKVFNLTIDEVDWEVEPGKVIAARGYNGAIPGPVLRGTEGETVRIIVKNNLKESTSVHWHGLYVPNAMDGVPYINQEPIRSGESFTYEFTLRNSGTHMYHSHHNSLDQVNRGLLGAFIVDPRDAGTYPAYDREYILVLNDLSLGFTINGKSFPATDAVVAKKGERVWCGS